MPVRPIRLFPDDCLSTRCHPATKDSVALLELIEDLKETMYASPGVGLAAPQIGVSQRVSVIDAGRYKKKGYIGNGLIVLINPEMIASSGEQTPREGCLSVPDLLANVRRFMNVTVETQTLEGGKRTIQAEGFEALALQHELDHLNGMLFLDRVSDLKTDVFRRKSY